MDDLREEDKIAEDDHPFIIAEEIDESQVEEKAEIKLNVEGCEFLPEELRIFDVPEVMTSPNQEQYFHIKDDEEDDIGKRGQYEEEISTF